MTEVENQDNPSYYQEASYLFIFFFASVQVLIYVFSSDLLEKVCC